ncbi:Serine-rich coiled-coil domain-containing protein 1 [Bagarius yarrelli]|uniref:Serine-rich coiled-coil domain-containing protein 1 n=1 Tax=Bagarius yarrelli TaxID=175774 RepID=A0A556TXL8_BAGYA|nr:Serine-rich coiled-coil domain-containing protein 1 [Bagarius yarrelli]
MGESGPRRSTLVSRLPIFRRSVRKRQESLPSSPSSGGVGNGVNTSSPSSTNSSSSSTGKRRSLFRTPSISFHSKRNSELRADSNQLGADNRSRLSEPSFSDSCNNKTRHSFGFGGHKKKLSRSQTEDFEKAPTNRNVFINCISSGTNEGDDSGFLDDVSSKRSSKPKKLLPKSFSAHHRFSKNSSNQVEQSQGKDDAPKTGTPDSWPGELAVSSLQSPIVSEDRTTAITPSDFVHVTEDTVSEVDALPVPSPAEVPAENISQAVSTSETCTKPDQCPAEKPTLPDSSQTANVQCESTPVQTEPEKPNTAEEQHQDPIEASENQNEPNPELNQESSSNLEPRGRMYQNTVLVHQLGKSAGLGKVESRPSYLRKPHTVSMCSSMSPRREVIRLERRLRSASEGAGGPRLHLNLKEHTCMETSMLAKRRTNSSSSKLGSLDVLNNLGSSELDEDDLMLDLELSDDQRHRHASQDDSSQSLASCLNLLPSPLDLPTDHNTAKECRENNRESRPVSLFVPCDDELFSGLETLPFRPMQQDCTAMKTLLLRLRRVLQEDPGRDESHTLQQQLKERDELIRLLQIELEIARSAQKPLCQKTDKTTQTDPLASEAVHPSRFIGSSTGGSLPRERRSGRLSSWGEERYGGGTGTRDPAAVHRRFEQTYSSSSEATTPRKLEHPGPSQIPRAVVSGSSCSLSSDSERLGMSRPHSSFSGRLGQPPRGPLSLHMYSRKNVFLQHSLYTTELQALGQQDA